MLRYSGYELSNDSREKLKRVFPPLFEKMVGHHITEIFGVDENYQKPKMPSQVNVIGHAVDRDLEVEALLISIDGTVDRPKDGKFHITWSLGKTAKPVYSNKILHKAVLLDEPIPITVEPKVFTHSTFDMLKKRS